MHVGEQQLDQYIQAYRQQLEKNYHIFKCFMPGCGNVFEVNPGKENEIVNDANGKPLPQYHSADSSEGINS